jgi:hypothetical protein
MSDFFGKLKSGAGKVAFEAEKLTRVNRAKSELETLKRQLEELFSGLGKATYRQVTANEVVDPNEWITKIDDLKVRIETKEREVQAISADVYNPSGASAPQPTVPPVQPAPFYQPAPVYQPAPTAPITEPMPIVEIPPTAKFCPNCGQEASAQVKFCTNCGSKI